MKANTVDKILAWALMGSIVFASQVAAQGRNCAPREVVVERLAEKYGEVVVDQGLSTGGLAEMYANTDTGTWTFTVTTPNEITCLIASGEYFSRMAPTPQGDPT
jgi:hypothetical protein